MTPKIRRPQLWQIVLAALVGIFVTLQTTRADRAAIRLIEEGTRAEASILVVEQGRRGGDTPTVCQVEFRIALADGASRQERGGAPNDLCQQWEKMLARHKIPTAEALIGRDGAAMLLAEAQARKNNLTVILPWLRFLLAFGGVLVISIVIVSFVKQHD